MRVCVFCASAMGTVEAFRVAAAELGRELARRGHGVVYGGADVGLMKVVADAALAEGGEVFGVIPQSMVERELAHGGLTRLEIVASMHERKARMAELADAFVALPGGFGTWDELCEIVTWRQLGYHSKPVALWNVAGFYDPFLALVGKAVDSGVVRAENTRLFAVFEDREEMFAYLGLGPVK